MLGDYHLSVYDYLSILRRRALVMILVFGTAVAAAVAFAVMQPRVYESTATILGEAPQVQVAVGSNAPQQRQEDRVNLLRQRLMTRENLIQIAEKHQLFQAGGRDAADNTAIANAMRNSIRLELLGAAANPWAPPSSSVSFNLSFQHGDPAKALSVTQELVDLFLGSNRKDRVEQASRTKEFLSGEADRVRKELEGLEAKIAAFKSQQSGTTTMDATATTDGLQALEADLRVTEREHQQALNELRSLEVDLAAARRGILAPGVVDRPAPTQTEQNLEQARAQLAGLQATYSENHPDVLSLVRRIRGLEQAVVSEARMQTPSRTAAKEQAFLAASRLEAQIEAARSRADLMASQQSSLRSSIGQLRAQTARAPQRERQLAALERDYEAAKTKYDELRTQLLSAQVVENLEGGQQAERFTLLEPPLLPDYPIKPSRKKIVGAGLVVAAGAAIGVAWLLEMLFARVWGVNALTAVTSQRPLAVIQYIQTQSEIAAAEKLRIRAIWLSLVAGLVVLLMVHFWVMPIQTVLLSVTSRLD
jgi:polysaccharide biosynthesis transport protein